MDKRIFGLEIEFGCMPPDTDPFLSPDLISAKAKDCAFYQQGLGIVDIHYRGRDEPPGNEHAMRNPRCSVAVHEFRGVAGSVTFDDFRIFFRQVERVGESRRRQYAHRLFGEDIEAVHHAGGVGFAFKAVDALQQRPAIGKT